MKKLLQICEDTWIVPAFYTSWSGRFLLLLAGFPIQTYQNGISSNSCQWNGQSHEIFRYFSSMVWLTRAQKLPGLGRELSQVSEDKNSTSLGRNFFVWRLYTRKGQLLFLCYLHYSVCRTWSPPCQGGYMRWLRGMAIPLNSRFYYVNVYMYKKKMYICFLML